MPPWLPPLLTPLAIVATALGAWAIQRGIARRRAAIDFIAKLEVGNPEWRTQHRIFVDVTRDGSDEIERLLLSPAPDPGEVEAWKRYVAVVTSLEHHEAVAVAINHKIIDRAIYQDWGRTRYVQAWNRVKDAVVKRRDTRGTPSLYEHFQALAEKWAKPGELD